MNNTIDLLETIGKDASLRRASGEELARTLAGLDASETLKQAAASGDSSHLRQELGDMEFGTSNHPANTNVTAPDVPDEDDDDDDDGDGDAEAEPEQK